MAGTGRLTYVDWPDDCKSIDIGGFCADSTKFMRSVGWTGQVDLRDGLTRMGGFYRKHLGPLRRHARPPSCADARATSLRQRGAQPCPIAAKVCDALVSLPLYPGARRQAVTPVIEAATRRPGRLELERRLPPWGMRLGPFPDCTGPRPGRQVRRLGSDRHQAPAVALGQLARREAPDDEPFSAPVFRVGLGPAQQVDAGGSRAGAPDRHEVDR